MGMRATFRQLSDNDLKELKSVYAIEDNDFEEVEDADEEVALVLDIDKMWDVLHFVLTGASSLEPIKNSPLSEAVVGVTPIEDVEEYIAYTEKSRIKDIVISLDNFDMEKALEEFRMEKCKAANLYPDIWDYEEESDEIKEEIIDCFQAMREFYKKILAANINVIVTIC